MSGFQTTSHLVSIQNSVHPSTGLRANGILNAQLRILGLWSWLENQMLCGVKLVPLGQVAGQRLLTGLADKVPATVDEALSLVDGWAVKPFMVRLFDKLTAHHERLNLILSRLKWVASL